MHCVEAAMDHRFIAASFYALCDEWRPRRAAPGRIRTLYLRDYQLAHFTLFG
jgi:hypothetical protein